MKILLIEDEKTSSEMIKISLEKRGYKVITVETGKEGLQFFLEENPDIVLLDWRLPDKEGDEVFAEFKNINPTVPVIFITAYGDVEKAVKVLKMGAFHYLTKPIELETLIHVIRQAEEKIKLKEEIERLKDQIQKTYSIKNFVAESERMQKILSLAFKVARSDSTVLIYGESGTGKEMLAKIIHNASHRSNGPFISVNIAALPESLVEAELFGAEKGAYTGAVSSRKGKFEAADGGTIFLDEVGELFPPVQVKLLRVLQEREIQRIGSNRTIKINVRIIAATNRNLEELVAEGKFRKDLFYRLNVIKIELPPLRERKEDIPYLVDLFIKKFSRRDGKLVKGITKNALSYLLKYDYPGNVRELENIIERAIVIGDKNVIDVEDLPVFVLTGDKRNIPDRLPLPERLKEIERKMIKEALERNYFNQRKTAEDLGISESTLRYRMKILGIKNR